MNKDNKEIRSIDSEQSELRTIGDSRIIEGYGIVFNTESRDLGGFTEIIRPESVVGVLETSDILSLMNHKIDRGVLARSNKGVGSLKLTVDDKGVKYRFEAPKFDLGNELVEGVKRGDIKYSSFSFKVDPKNESYERRSDGTYLRTITKFHSIHDMSPCYIGAYEDTTVALRSLDEFKSLDQDTDGTESGVANTTLEPTENKGTKTFNSKELYLKTMTNIYKNKNK